MSGPASVSNSSVRIESLGEVWLRLGNELLQFGDLANLLEGKDLILLVTVDSKTGGVITTVFKTGETCSWASGNGTGRRR